MALVVADRVKETTTSTGTGAITLGGAEPNFRTFSSVLSDADTTYYAIIDDNNLAFEVGLGTYASSGNTITRTTVLASSNSNNAVNFSAGTKDVFITYPADKSVNRDASGNVSVSGGVTATSFTGNITGNVTGNVTGDVTGDVTGAVTATQVDLTGQGDLRLQDASGGQYVALQAPATVGSSFTFTLPSADGSADQLLKTDGSGNLSFATVNPAPSFTATADGALTNGAPVIVTSDGKVALISGGTAGTSGTTTIESSTDYKGELVYDPDTQRLIYIYAETDAIRYIVYTINSSGDTFTASSAGAGVVSSERIGSGPSAVYDTGSNKIILCYQKEQGTSRGCVRTGTVDTSNDTVSWGTEATFGGNAAGFRYGGCGQSITYDENANKSIVIYHDNDNNYYLMARTVTVSGTNVSVGTAITINSNGFSNKTRAISYNKYHRQYSVIASPDPGSSNASQFKSVGISGTDLSIISTTSAGYTSTDYFSITYHEAAQVNIYTFSTTGGFVGKITMDANGGISASSFGYFNSSGMAQQIGIQYHAAAEKIGFAYMDAGDNYKHKFRAGKINAAGTSIDFDTEVTLDTYQSH